MTEWDQHMMGWRQSALVIRLKGGPVLSWRPGRRVAGFFPKRAEDGRPPVPDPDHHNAVERRRDG